MFKIAEDVDLPANAATQTFAFLARRGAGKTYSAGVVVEALLGGHVQVVVVDPVGTWWGLRLAADGVSPGIDIPVFGGLRGDIPLEPTAGAVVARLCAEQRISVVLDVSMFSGAEQRRFVTDFARELFQLKKENRGPIHVVFEEAQEFFPQVVQSDSAAMVGAVLKLWKIGRNFGIGGTLISQRPQEVNKSALNLTECLVTGQLTGPHERKTIAGWVTDQGMDRRALDELPSLPVGTVYLWSPQWLRMMVKTRFIAKRTFDASATPEASNADAELSELRPIDLTAVQKAMALTVEHVKANDPKALRAEIADLKKQLAIAPPRLNDEKVLAVVAAERDKYQERCRAYERELHQAGITIAQVRMLVPVTRSYKLIEDVVKAQMHDEAMKLMRSFAPNDEPEPMVLPPAGAIPFGSALPKFAPDDLFWDNTNNRLGPVSAVAPKHDFAIERRGNVVANAPLKVKVTTARAPRDGSARMLIALAELYPKPLTERQLGTLAVMKTSGGTFGTYLSRLKTSGLVVREGGMVSLTPAGRAAAGKVKKPATARELLDMWREKIPAKAADMLEWMAAEREPKTKDELAAFSGLQKGGGTFDTYLSKLAANGLAVRTKGGLKAVEELWL